MAKHAKDQATGLPVAPEKVTVNEIEEIQPEVSEYSGTYRNKNDDMIYALAIKEDPIRGRTHHARNTGWFWEGTKAEFEANFVKE